MVKDTQKQLLRTTLKYPIPLQIQGLQQSYSKKQEKSPIPLGDY